MPVVLARSYTGRASLQSEARAFAPGRASARHGSDRAVIIDRRIRPRAEAEFARRSIRKPAQQVERAGGKRTRRGPQTRAGDAQLTSDTRHLVDGRPSYGYRRIAALLKRERRSAKSSLARSRNASGASSFSANERPRKSTRPWRCAQGCRIPLMATTPFDRECDRKPLAGSRFRSARCFSLVEGSVDRRGLLCR
jgi:hypothetical protein